MGTGKWDMGTGKWDMGTEARIDKWIKSTLISTCDQDYPNRR